MKPFNLSVALVCFGFFLICLKGSYPRDNLNGWKISLSCALLNLLLASVNLYMGLK